MDEQKTIVVNQSAIPAQVMNVLRMGLLSLSSYLVGAGIIQEATGTAVIGFAMIVIPAAWSLYVTTRQHTKMRTMANETPSDVARVK